MKILFMGTPTFAIPSLSKLAGRFELACVITRPDKPAGRGKKLKPPPIKEFALSKGLRVCQPTDVEELIGEINRYRPDCIVVVAFGRILPKEVLKIPPFGTINLHASLLPKYRGAAPIQRALMAGDRVTGNTVMLVNERMDAGDILSQESVSIEEEDTYETLSEKLSVKGAELLLKTLELWFEGAIEPIPQEEEKATYAPPIMKEEYRVCWKANALSVRDRVRALYPNAYTTFRGERVKILGVKVVEGEGIPGEIVQPRTMKVACGRGCVEILRLVSPKGKRLTRDEFIRGYSPKKGELLK